MLDHLPRAALPSARKTLSEVLQTTAAEERSAGMPFDKIRGISLAVLLTVATSVTGLTNQAAADTMTQLNAARIVADMGAGWNLGNQMEANSNGVPSETAWGQPTITQALVDKVKAAGFKTIRIPVSYLGHIG